MTTPNRQGGRLPVLDGIRALAAFYVLVFHEFDITVPQMGERLPLPLRAIRNMFSFGHLAVCVFIVLSGFSLMLPMARSDSWKMKGGTKGYLRRRGRRVLPPYYAALAVSLIVMVGHDHLGLLSPGSLVSHLLLVQNWGSGWAVNINGPMWSVATEWQIYFLMPLVLIPLWRRYGATATIAVAFLIPSLVFFVVPNQYNLAWAAPWFLGSFALGMWGAQVAFSPAAAARRFRDAPWRIIAVVAAVVVVAML
ncbi:MAG TPA: acyltransferase, partial [Acidimicrobiales bacterium]